MAAYPLLDQQACALSFLSYLGESITGFGLGEDLRIAKQVSDLINTNIPNVDCLMLYNQVDWEVVWGPAFQLDFPNERQQSMLYVAKQISQPDQYMVVIRGTNFYSWENWIKDDSEVGTTVPWTTPGNNNYGNISESSSKDLETLTSVYPLDGIPGTKNNLNTFLQSISSSSVNILFTGHSLGGCMAPTLAQYFSDRTGSNGTWDPNNNSIISVTSFAGQTPGDADFAAYLNSQIPSTRFNRYNNLNDVVPLAWNATSMATIPTLYANSGIGIQDMNSCEMDFFNHYLKAVAPIDYTQIGKSVSFKFDLSTSAPPNGAGGTSFLDQVAYQHHYSYPNQLSVPEVIQILSNNP